MVCLDFYPLRFFSFAVGIVAPGPPFYSGPVLDATGYTFSS